MLNYLTITLFPDVDKYYILFIEVKSVFHIKIMNRLFLIINVRFIFIQNAKENEFVEIVRFHPFLLNIYLCE